MPFKFGKRSMDNMVGVYTPLQVALAQAIEISPIDFSILCGHRDESAQEDYYRKGLSKCRYPESKHNTLPSLAIDFAPYPIDWKDTHSFAVVAGVIMSCMIAEGLTPRWGGDWDRDGSTRDQTFMDWGHIEVL